MTGVPPTHEIIPISTLRGIASEDDIYSGEITVVAEYSGEITVVAEDGRIFTFVKPDRMGTLPDDLIKVIFTRLITTSELSAFSQTCNRMYKILYDLPVYAFTSKPLCRFIFMRNDSISNTAIQLMVAATEEPNESFAIINDRIRFCNPSAKLQNAQDIFYTTLKKCCFQQNSKIDCVKLVEHCITAFTLFTKASKIYPPEVFHAIQLRMSCVFSRLDVEVHEDIINTNTDQLGESITFNSFKASAARIKKLIADKDAIDIEGSLRNSLRAKYGDTFKAYASQCLGAFPTSPIVADMEQQLKAPLLAEKAAIEAELAVLCGPNKFNGTINDAYMEMVASMNMQDAPEVEIRIDSAACQLSSLLLGAPAERCTSDHLTLVHLDMSNAFVSEEVQFEHSILRREWQGTAHYKKISAKVKFYELVARLKTLAQWEEGTDLLIGGRLFEVCNKLEDIGFTALFKVRKRGEFLAELACPVTEENKQVRFDFLQKCAYS